MKTQNRKPLSKKQLFNMLNGNQTPFCLLMLVKKWFQLVWLLRTELDDETLLLKITASTFQFSLSCSSPHSFLQRGVFCKEKHLRIVTKWNVDCIEYFR